ncbi:2-amino-4-hydroxy-6-hydroxymethyldihydropteridine diphosphokinase [Prevotella sp. HJM029]|uniref:2-amino-4-hydroxy-6- hydroxymethyldihydropteridine diphosphokinase n=1 Tax=Prevotella sp. HJM029 TaxID=1433844 RepID=UPI00048DABA9|nr:2-amino-4-hydroxy-6-hydroxymethyldihydropteridine diphosphokinase [Prevotella sp. HJM029]
MHTIYLSLGTNLGSREDNLERALRLLQEQVGALLRRSSVHETTPWGFESSHMFLNLCVCMATSLSPLQLLATTKQIEIQLGRTQKSAHGHYVDRLIDIDILLYDDAHVNESDLIIPHPHMYERDFVMLPLNEILDDSLKDL